MECAGNEGMILTNESNQMGFRFYKLNFISNFTLEKLEGKVPRHIRE